MLVNSLNNNRTTSTANPLDLFEENQEIVGTPNKEIEVGDTVYIEGQIEAINQYPCRKKYDVLLPTSCITVKDVPVYNIVDKLNTGAYANWEKAGEIKGSEETFELIRNFMSIPMDVIKSYADFPSHIETKPGLINLVSLKKIKEFMDWVQLKPGDVLEYKWDDDLCESKYAVILNEASYSRCTVWLCEEQRITIIYEPYKYWKKTSHNFCTSDDNLINTVNKLTNMIDKFKEVK